MGPRQIDVTVTFGKQVQALAVPAGTTLRQLGAVLAERFDVAPPTVKLFLHGGRGILRPEEQPQRTLEEAGILPGMRLKLIASRQADVAAVQAAREEPRLPGFDHELRRELRRAGADGSGMPAQAPPSGQYTFRNYEAWQRQGLRPPPGEALKLLHRLAADPGIVGVMSKHKWAVGLLSEMPPEGKVGVSPVCILGVNINRGQEISLRLRTDDLKGFRRYDRIRETLLHELAHMVWGEHDNNFKELNSQLRRECDSFDWRGAAARTLAGAAFEGRVQYDLPPERQTVMQQTQASSGQTLRQLAGDRAGPAATASPTDARHAAAEAALRRAGGAAAGPSAQQQQEQQAQLQQAQQQFSKGQSVLYRQRGGSLQEAKIVAVDLSVLPPSYGIELPDSGYRETEASRLQPLPQQAATAEDGSAAVEGLGHRDAATEAKEDAVRALEQ